MIKSLIGEGGGREWGRTKRSAPKVEQYIFFGRQFLDQHLPEKKTRSIGSGDLNLPILEKSSALKSDITPVRTQRSSRCQYSYLNGLYIYGGHSSIQSAKRKTLLQSGWVSGGRWVIGSGWVGEWAGGVST